MKKIIIIISVVSLVAAVICGAIFSVVYLGNRGNSPEGAFSKKKGSFKNRVLCI